MWRRMGRVYVHSPGNKSISTGERIALLGLNVTGVKVGAYADLQISVQVEDFSHNGSLW